MDFYENDMELIDFRTKITSQTQSVLEAHARATGRTQADIAREALAEWAARQIHISTLTVRLTRTEGSLKAVTPSPVTAAVL